MDEAQAREGLIIAREKVAIDRQWNGENSRSAGVYRDAYGYAEAYIRILEAKIADFEHVHEWINASFDGAGESHVLRKCGCGEYQMWSGIVWRKVEFKNA